MRAIYSISFLMLLLAMSACTNCDKSPPCPDVNLQQVEWIELHTNDSLIFEDSTGLQRRLSASILQTDFMTEQECSRTGVGICQCDPCRSNARVDFSGIHGQNNAFTWNLSYRQSGALGSIFLVATNLGSGTTQFTVPLSASDNVSPELNVQLGQRFYTVVYKARLINSTNEDAVFFYLTEDEGIVGFKEADVEGIFARVW